MSTLLTLVGIIVGAVLTYLFTRSHENKKHLRLLQTEAYADYLRCVADAAHVNLQTDEANLFARAADAKTRICLYGSNDVIALLAEFERAGGAIRNEQQRAIFLRLVAAMRCDPKVGRSDLNAILFGGAT
jgi:hypothetical protein